MKKPIAIRVVRKILSDGSPVFNVELGGLSLPAYTEKDADALAEKLSTAIDEHTTERPRIYDVNESE